MVSRGHFVLHSRAVPPLGAGDYVLEGDQQVPDGRGGMHPTEPYRGHLRVTSPRFRMPPDQVLSTFPPANAEGAFEDRLPQIVLRRRTLPWERVVDPADRTIPWLALVVIAEGEGTLAAEAPIADCVTAGVVLSGPNDVASGVYLSVPQSVVAKVFPTREDLPLLVHVREVDIADTELASGDDDGFLAVVLANRLPQFDRVACAPVRYLACLVNLEGQLGALPPPSPPVDLFVFEPAVLDVRALAPTLAASADLRQMGDGRPRDAEAMTTARGVVDRGAAAAAGTRTARFEPPDDWAASVRRVEDVAVSAAPEQAGAMVRDAMRSGFRFVFEPYIVERTLRFPVLAHWSFTCDGGGSFETLMQGLDVGLLGTASPVARPARARPDCAVPPGGDAPPEAPAPRPLPELAETGHVGLPHRTRRGEAVRAWYRGPLTPHLIEREGPDSEGRLPLVHVADQLRRLVPDGREDLAYAAAFEIGRLLALSQPAVVAALMRWRQEQFGAARARALARALAVRVGALGLADLPARGIAELGAALNRRLVVLAAEAPGRVLAEPRPLADPGRPVEVLCEGDLDAILGEGFGIAPDLVRHVRSTGDLRRLDALEVPRAACAPPLDAASLRAALDAEIGRLVEDAIGPDQTSGPVTGRPRRARRTAAPPPSPEETARARGGEVLDALLRAGTAANEEEDR